MTHLLGFVLACFWLLTTLALASPDRNVSSSVGVSKYSSSFLGGAVININQPQSPGKASVPAIRTVSAEWNVPWMKAPPDADLSNPNNRHKMAQWVGILGNACDDKNWSPFLQAGTATDIDENGITTAYAWVEWFPAGSHNIPSDAFTINPGDQIRVIVNVYTRTMGHVYMMNLRTGQEYEKDVIADSPQDPKFLICLGSGTAQFFQEWVIANDRAELPVFNNVTFANVEAVDRRGGRFDFNTETRDYWNMVDADRLVAVPEGINSNSFVVYSPEGSSWTPSEGDKL
ncbi:concanavalin A-like lectin/glucanase [Hypoxylon cercidicola]|nr:concanavalin A-like lectin/glucanase [Hypoxylon cercidicola]